MWLACRKIEFSFIAPSPLWPGILIKHPPSCSHLRMTCSILLESFKHAMSYRTQLMRTHQEAAVSLPGSGILA